MDKLQVKHTHIFNGEEYVKYKDYVHLWEMHKQLEMYCDDLANSLPCLPKDLEILRNANSAFAEENHKLKNDKQNIYKCLQDGDIISINDIFLNDEDIWEPIKDACLHDSGWPIGYKYDKTFHRPMMRKLNN